MSKGLSQRKKDAQAEFNELFDGKDKPTPERVIVDVLHGAGNNKITDRQLDAAKTLLPYRLPKLAQIDAKDAGSRENLTDFLAKFAEDSDE